MHGGSPVFTNAPADIEPLEFEYKYDRTGRKYIVAKRKPMTYQQTRASKTYTLLRKNSGFDSTLIFTIYHDDNGKATNGTVCQMVKFGDRDPYSTQFQWIIDGVEVRFEPETLHSIDTLKKLWIDASTGNHGKNIPYTEVK